MSGDTQCPYTHICAANHVRDLVGKKISQFDALKIINDIARVLLVNEEDLIKVIAKYEISRVFEHIDHLPAAYDLLETTEKIESRGDCRYPANPNAFRISLHKRTTNDGGIEFYKTVVEVEEENIVEHEDDFVQWLTDWILYDYQISESNQECYR